MDETALTEFKMFRTFLVAQIVTIILCSLIYLNYLLLGEFFFCFFLAGLTSVSLRKVRNRAITSVEESFKQPWKFTKGTLIYVLGSQLYKMIWENSGNINKAIEHVTRSLDKVVEVRKKEKRTVFNDSHSVLWIFVLYFGFIKLGFMRFF